MLANTLPRILITGIIALTIVLSQLSEAVRQQYLNGEWTLSDTVNKGYQNLKAEVPGGVYTDLMRNRIIDDIFYGSNDVKTRWVSKQTWNYTRIFKVNERLFKNKYVSLIFDGIDTFATIYVNGHKIASTDNMFVRYEFAVRDVITADYNVLSVVFESPVAIANYFFAKQSKNYTVVPKCVPDVYNGECHVNHIRKMQASFSWDWGPAFPSVGLWKNVYLNGFDNTYIKDATFSVQQMNNANVFKVVVYAAGNKDNDDLEGILSISIQDEISTHTVNFDFTSARENNGDFEIVNEFSLPQAQFNLWWPNGIGPQTLYPMNVTLIVNGEESTKRMKIGIRDVQLIQKPTGSGLTFRFEVNGIPVFAKGSNMVPSHILPEQSNNETLIRSIMQNAKDVHMNMIRIWGGGLYEADRLYEIADEMGIMIWLDFGFACSMYPTTSDFLSSVSKEVEHQVKRLQHHPSVVLWAGNNENEAALRFNWYGTASNSSVYEADYRLLYGKIIRDIVLKLDPSRPYLSSSPTNGLETEKSNWIAANPQSNIYGDIHFYNYVLDSWNMNYYPTPRFASEYGYQALPSYNSFLTATNNKSDLYIGTEFMKHRQHHPLGYGAMELLIRMRLDLPKRGNNENFNKAFIFYSQITQAMAIKVETEHYRQWMSYLDESGNGMTMGALYWQLNCPWVAPTWSSVDALGKWKMLHYFAKDFFAPVIVTSHQKVDNTVDLYAVSDLLYPIYNATFSVRIFNWNSLALAMEKTRTINIPTGSIRVTKINLNYFLAKANNMSTKNSFIELTLSNGTSLLAPPHYIYPVALKYSAIQFAKVQIDRVEGVARKMFRIVVKTNLPAVFVWLDSTIPGRFSENGFTLVQQQKEIYFITEIPRQTMDVSESLTITHLRDEYYFSYYS